MYFGSSLKVTSVMQDGVLLYGGLSREKPSVTVYKKEEVGCNQF